MSGFLDPIVAAVRADVERADYADGLPPEPSRRPASLRAAVEKAPESWAILVERKRRSPGSKVPDLPERGLEDFVRLVEGAGVDALSCLATGPSFRGSPQEVAALAQRTRLPVLFKDFVVDPRQIDVAHRSGASAVLLIARLESERRIDLPLRDLADRAHEFGLEVLLELHSVEELKVAATLSADLYGVNVRDLDALTLRPEVAQRTFVALGRSGPLLGLSGIEGAEEARRFRSWGAWGIVVGGAAARTPDPEALLAELRRVGKRVGT